MNGFIGSVLACMLMIFLICIEPEIFHVVETSDKLLTLVYQQKLEQMEHRK